MPFCTHLVVAFQSCGVCFPAKTRQCCTQKATLCSCGKATAACSSCGLESCGLESGSHQAANAVEDPAFGTDKRQQAAVGVQLTFVFLPFWCPINMKVCPSILARPQTIAGSSRPARSPCSSTNLSEMLRATSRNVGLFGCRATCKRCTGVRREYVSFRNCTKVHSTVCKISAPNFSGKCYSQERIRV